MAVKDSISSYLKYQDKGVFPKEVASMIRKICRMVYKSATPNEQEDLLQELMIQLYKAYNYWDKRKSSYTNYAYEILRGFISYWIIQERLPVKMTPHSIYLYRRLLTMYNEMTPQEFDNIIPEDLNLSYNLREGTLENIKNLIKNKCGYLDCYNEELGKYGKYENQSEIDEKLDKEFAMRRCKKLLSHFPERRRKIIEAYYFSEDENITNKKVSKLLNENLRYVEYVTKKSRHIIKELYYNKEC